MKTTAPVRAADLLQVGYWFSREERLFEITSWEPTSPLQVEARAADTGDIHHFTLTELFAPQPPTQFAATQAELVSTPASDTSTVSQAVDADTLPAHLLERADHIIRAVEAVQSHIEQAQRCHRVGGETLSLTDITRQACQALPKPISLSTYYDYRQKYRAHGGERGQHGRVVAPKYLRQDAHRPQCTAFH